MADYPWEEHLKSDKLDRPISQFHVGILSLPTFLVWHTRSNLPAGDERDQLTKILNFQVSTLVIWLALVLAVVVSGVLGWLLLTLLLCIAFVGFGLWTLTLAYINAARARAGREWQYPRLIRFFR